MKQSNDVGANFLSAANNFIVHRFFVLGFIFLTACASAPTTHPLDHIKEDSWLLLEGSNTHPVLSDDDQLLAFESRNREDHQSTQIYVYSFGAKSERRINFNRADNYLGEIINGPKRTILFASSFDEILESQTRSRGQLDRIPSLDLYSTQLDGSGLKRLMSSAGYDGSPTQSANGEWLAFISRRDKNEDLFILNLKNKKTTKVASALETSHSPTFSKKKNVLAYFVKSKSTNGGVDLYHIYMIEPPFKAKTLLFESAEPVWRLQWIDEQNLMVVRGNTNSAPTTLELWSVGTKQKLSEAKTKFLSRDVAVTHNLKIAIFSEKHSEENASGDSKNPSGKDSLPYQIGFAPIQFVQTPPNH